MRYAERMTMRMPDIKGYFTDFHEEELMGIAESVFSKIGELVLFMMDGFYDGSDGVHLGAHRMGVVREIVKSEPNPQSFLTRCRSLEN
jgi:hypothetical protein